MNVRKLKIMLALLTCTLVYQNCGGEFNANGEGMVYASLSSCDAGTQALFQSTFYPFTTQNCVACHTAAGPGLGAFADPNVSTAYGAFTLLTANTIASYATNAGHAPPHTGTQNNAAITPIMSTWKTTTNCSSDGGTTGAIVAAGKAMGLTTAGPSYGASTAKVISWDLSKDVSGVTNLVGTLQIKVYVDIHSLGPGNNSYNYVFVNPTILGNSASNIHVKGLHLYINGILAGEVTAYNVVDVVLPKANTKTLISGIGQPYLMDIDPGDMLSIDIDALEYTTATPTTGLPTGP
jgi:hypothetical protein